MFHFTDSRHPSWPKTCSDSLGCRRSYFILPVIQIFRGFTKLQQKKGKLGEGADKNGMVNFIFTTQLHHLFRSAVAELNHWGIAFYFP